MNKTNETEGQLKEAWQTIGKLRWANASPEEIAAHCRMMQTKRWQDKPLYQCPLCDFQCAVTIEMRAHKGSVHRGKAGRHKKPSACKRCGAECAGGNDALLHCRQTTR